VGVTLLVMTGSLLPISTLACSLLRTPDPRTRQGIDQTRLLHRVLTVTASALRPMVLEFWGDRSESNQPGGAARGGRGKRAAG